MKITNAPVLIPAPSRIRFDGSVGVACPIGVHELTISRRSLERRGIQIDGLQVSITDAHCGGSATHAQSYTLTVSSSGIRIEAPSLAGARYGITTLEQLVRQYGAAIPSMEIFDEPAFATRGLMLDVSRDRVPTMAHLCSVVDTLASLKMNHLQLYTEHTFAYEGHEEAWVGHGAITADEMKRLDAYAQERGVELAANQNCFGHLRSWLELPRYRHLAETHGDWMFDVWPRSGPFSLCPTDDRSLEFVRGLISQLAPTLRSPYLNIGCDETYDIAYGRSKQIVEQLGRPRVYMEFVNKIATVARESGKIPMFWADIALSHPEAIELIPEDMVCLAWGYEPESPFKAWCNALNAKSRRAWVCPGTGAWRSFTGRTFESEANMLNAAACDSTSGCDGFLLCEWGDTGHWQQWPVTLNAIAKGAAASWAGSHTRFNPDAISLHCFSDRSGKIAKFLDELGDLDLPLRRICGALSRPDIQHIRNQTAIFIDMFKNWNEQTEIGRASMWQEASECCRSMTARWMDINADALTHDEINHTLNMTQLACDRGAVRRKSGGDQQRFARQLRDRIDVIQSDHRRLWRIRSREGGLEHSCGFWNKVIEATEAGS